MADTAIRVSGLGKRYRIGETTRGYKTLRDAIGRALRLSGSDGATVDQEANWIWALKDLDLEVPEGQVLGVIGRNGAGKSTLLKILSAITEPTTGSAEIHGRVASLLEVGTGFHGELTGRENIFLNGAILGMSRREIHAKFDAIVAFAEVQRFLDTPVKRYSSGMYVRLAFAVAAHLEPDILVIDEVLAVGDLAFQRKCLGRIGEAARAGRTVLFVSHNMGMIQSLCVRAILLEAGQLIADAAPAVVVQEYVDRTLGDTVAAASVRFEERPELPFQLFAAALCDANGRHRNHFDLFESAGIQVEYCVRESIPGTHVQLCVYQQGDLLFVSWDSDTQPTLIESRVPGRYRSTLRLPAPFLKGGHYQLRFGMGIARVRGIHNPEATLTLSIVEQSVGTNLLSYSADREGRLAVPVNWYTERLD